MLVPHSHLHSSSMTPGTRIAKTAKRQHWHSSTQSYKKIPLPLGKIPPNSLYDPIRENVEAYMRIFSPTIPVDVFAARFVPQILKRNPPTVIYGTDILLFEIRPLISFAFPLMSPSIFQIWPLPSFLLCFLLRISWFIVWLIRRCLDGGGIGMTRTLAWIGGLFGPRTFDWIWGFVSGLPEVRKSIEKDEGKK